MTTMRAKMRVSSVHKFNEEGEQLTFNGVSKADGYPPDGSDENNSFALWTPAAELRMTVTNPALIGKFAIGDTFYVDFTPAPK